MGKLPGTSQRAVTSVTEDYLKLIYSIEEWENADGISINDLASHMGVVASTASENVRRLTELGYVIHEPYQKAHLTDAGRVIAIAMIRRHRLLETYLYEKLDFEWDEVHKEAEVLEHAVSDTLLEHLDHALGYPLRDPHGDPIPARDGSWFSPPMIPLVDAPVGTQTTVVRISDSNPEILRDLGIRGIVLDCHVHVDARSDALKMMTLTITPPYGKDNDTRTIELGDVATQAIFVATDAGVQEEAHVHMP